MPIVNVKVIENFFTEEMKQRLIVDLTNAFCAATFEAARPYIYVVIEEVKPGQWGLGGRRLPDPEFLINEFAGMVETAAVEMSRTYNVPMRNPPRQTDPTQPPP